MYRNLGFQQNPQFIGRVQSLIIQEFKEGSALTAFFSLTLATIGSASYSGLILTYIQLVICAIVSYYSIKILLKCAVKRRLCSYQELAEVSYGKKFRWFANLEIFVGNGGAIIVYFNNISTLIQTFIVSVKPEDSDWVREKGYIIFPFVVATLIVLPLSLFKELKKLRYLWMSCLLAIIFICGVIIKQSLQYQDLKHNARYMARVRPIGLTQTFPSIIYSFLCHYNVLDIFGELDIPDKKTMQKVVLTSTTFSFILYAVIILFGYMSFTNTNFCLKLNPNYMILMDYSIDIDGSTRLYSPLINAALLLLAIVLSLKMPIFINPSKEAIKDLCFPKRVDRFGQPVLPHIRPIFHFSLVAIPIYCYAAITIVIHDVLNALNILASSLFIIHSFLLPAIFYIKLPGFYRVKKHLVRSKILLVSITIFGIWNTVTSIIALFN